MTRIFVAGHNGMVGSAICKKLLSDGADIITASRDELDLINQSEVKNFFKANKFDQVYLAAAKVGGIHANNTYPAEFIYENLMIESNIVHQAYKSGVKQLLNLGSSCIYPKAAPQPLREEAILTGELEPTNEPYAVAKISGIKLCESYNRQYGVDYRSVMPTNLYGPGDNFHSENSHVIPAMIIRFHEAVRLRKEEVVIWGSGLPRREFLHVDDMAAASIFIMNLPFNAIKNATTPTLSHINIGTGNDISIIKLAQIIANVTGFTGEITTDPSRPDGTMRKLMNVSRLNNLGWSAEIDLETGIAATYNWFLRNIKNIRT